VVTETTVEAVEEPVVGSEPVVESTEVVVESAAVVEETPAVAANRTIAPTAAPAAAAPEMAVLAAAPATAPMWPGGLRARAGNEVVNVSWNAPTRNGGSPLLRYHVQRSLNAADWATVATVSASSRQARIGGLRNGTRYYFRVIAENAVGRSGPSWWAGATPSAAASGLPLNPYGLQLYAGNGVAMLSWRAPIRDVGGPVLSYRVQRSTNGSSWSTFAWLPPTQRSLRITGLTNGTRYFFRVVAVRQRQRRRLPELVEANDTHGRQSVHAAPPRGRGVVGG
jgi:hypothetical protein